MLDAIGSAFFATGGNTDARAFGQFGGNPGRFGSAVARIYTRAAPGGVGGVTFVEGDAFVEGARVARINGEENVGTGDVADDALQAGEGQVAILVGVVFESSLGDEKAFGGEVVEGTMAAEKDEKLVVGAVGFGQVLIEGGLDGFQRGVGDDFEVIKFVFGTQLLGDGFGIADGVVEVGPIVVVLDGEKEGVVFAGTGWGMEGWFWRGSGQEEGAEEEKNGLSHYGRVERVWVRGVKYEMGG